MSRIIVLPQGGDLVAGAVEILLEQGGNLEQSLLVFPGKRPAFAVYELLAAKKGKAMAGPEILSIDEWVDGACYELGLITRPVSSADGMALLYDLHRERGSFGAGKQKYSLDEFAPWGFKLQADFDELYIEGVRPEQLSSYQVLAEQKIPPRMQKAFSDLSGMYRAFYDKIQADGLSTRAWRYARVSEGTGLLNLDKYSCIILAGFYALTRAEQAIFKELLKLDKTTILLQDGPGIEGIIKTLGLKPEMPERKESDGRLHYHRARDIHGQVFGLNRILKGTDISDGRAIILPSPESLFPLVEYTLPLTGSEWNISMGYPLFRTPVYAMIEALRQALEQKRDGRYYIQDYLGLLLHPYLKNIKMGDSVQAGRILAHTVEEQLTRRQARFVELETIERDQELIEKFCERCSVGGGQAAGGELAQKHLANIHQVVFRNFDRIADIGDFAGKLQEIVSFISRQGSANRHPYTPAFMESLLNGLEDLRHSLLAGQMFDRVGSYFRFLEHFLSSIAVPFGGSSSRGLQVLGMMETRGIKFRQVFLLDANEGILPPGKSPDTLLPHALRQELGLIGYREREMILKYYFENLVSGAEEIHIFFREGDGQEKSRFVEDLMWREQQRTSDPKAGRPSPVFFRTIFGHSDPLPIAKNPEVIGQLGGMSFSPTMLDSYLKCPLQFYYRYVMGLKEKEGAGEEVDQSIIGKLVHGILEDFFDRRKGKKLAIVPGDRNEIIDICNKAFAEEFGQVLDGPIRLIKMQVENRLKTILQYHDQHLKNIEIVCNEDTLKGSMELDGGRLVMLNGRVDRIDRRGEDIFILDYKTGANPARPNNKEVQIDGRADWHKTVKSLQLPLYLLLYRAEHPEVPVEVLNSGLLVLGRKTIRQEYLFNASDARQELFERYHQVIKALISEILDPAKPFGDSPDPGKICPNCDFAVICDRQWITAAGR